MLNIPNRFGISTPIFFLDSLWKDYTSDLKIFYWRQYENQFKRSYTSSVLYECRACSDVRAFISSLQNQIFKSLHGQGIK